MMQSCTRRVSSSRLFVISLCLLVSIDSIASSDLIKSICEKSVKSSPAECEAALRQDPRSETAATPRELANICIDLAVTNATKCVESVQTLANTTTPAWKPALERCVKEFEYSVMEFRMGKEELTGARDAASYDVLVATDGAQRCDDAMKKDNVTNLPQVTRCIHNIWFFGFTAANIIDLVHDGDN